jgi:hypothetical protein
MIPRRKNPITEYRKGYWVMTENKYAPIMVIRISMIERSNIR